MKGYLGWGLRFSLSTLALAWLLHDGALKAQLAGLPRPVRVDWLIMGWLLAGIGEAAGLFRFWCCLTLAGISLPLRQAAALHFSGLFTSLFLPGMAGGDALKSTLLAVNFPERKYGGLLTVLMERLSGFLVITAWLALVASTRSDWFSRDPAAVLAVRAVLIATCPPAAALLLWFLLSRTRLMRTRIRRFPFREQIIRYERGFDIFVTHWGKTLAVLLSSFIGFGAYFLIFQCAALAYDAPLAWQDAFSILPLVDLITMLPVTVAGIGVREQTFQWIVAPLCGITPAQGVIVSLTGFFIASTWALMLGAPMFLWLRANLTPRCPIDA